MKIDRRAVTQLLAATGLAGVPGHGTRQERCDEMVARYRQLYVTDSADFAVQRRHGTLSWLPRGLRADGAGARRLWRMGNRNLQRRQ